MLRLMANCINADVTEHHEWPMACGYLPRLRGDGISVQYRAAAGASAIQLVQLAGTVPAYLKVARAGTTFTANTSADGVTWTPVAGSVVTLANLSGTLLAGLAVTSHNGGVLCTVTFDTVHNT